MEQQSEARVSASRVSGGISAARRLAELPGPRGLPLLGNAAQLEPKRLHHVLEGWAATFGSPYQLRLGPKRVLVIADNVVFGDLLRDRPDTFRRFSPMADMIDELGAKGVFSAEGEQWRMHRKLVMRAMTPEVVKHFFPTLVRMSERLDQRWDAAVRAGRSIDVPRDLKRFSMDVTSALAFGIDVDTLEHDDDPLQADVEKIFGVMCRRTAMPVPYWRYFKLPVDRESDAAVARVQAACSRFIAEARRRIAENPDLSAKPANMLEAMVAARDEPGSGFTDTDLIGNVMTILVAGEDTTANTIAWTLYFLATHPHAAARAVAEVDAVLGGSSPEFAALDRLHYLDAAAMEAIRLKPVAPLLFLEANRAVEVGGVRVEAGTPIWGVMRRTALDEAHFENATAFAPERWLHGDHVTAHDDTKRKIFGFGAGPRFCPGRYLAMVEIKMAVATILRRFAISLDGDPADVKEVFNFTMMPGSLPLKLALRPPR